MSIDLILCFLLKETQMYAENGNSLYFCLLLIVLPNNEKIFLLSWSSTLLNFFFKKNEKNLSTLSLALYKKKSLYLL